mmetsp:Transcript_97792/g.305006  ORF Transcript_97792/g.305006 Transcript_97792/m.305006 type:complete len:355 (-) Transcript_97792:170-1234(-)
MVVCLRHEQPLRILVQAQTNRSAIPGIDVEARAGQSGGDRTGSQIHTADGWVGSACNVQVLPGCIQGQVIGVSQPRCRGRAPIPGAISTAAGQSPGTHHGRDKARYQVHMPHHVVAIVRDIQILRGAHGHAHGVIELRRNCRPAVAQASGHACDACNRGYDAQGQLHQADHVVLAVGHIEPLGMGVHGHTHRKIEQRLVGRAAVPGVTPGAQHTNDAGNRARVDEVPGAPHMCPLRGDGARRQLEAADRVVLRVRDEEVPFHRVQRHTVRPAELCCSGGAEVPRSTALAEAARQHWRSPRHQVHEAYGVVGGVRQEEPLPARLHRKAPRQVERHGGCDPAGRGPTAPAEDAGDH